MSSVVGNFFALDVVVTVIVIIVVFVVITIIYDVV